MAGNFASLVNTLNRFAVLAHRLLASRITLAHPLPRLLLRSLIPLHGFLALKTLKNQLELILGYGFEPRMDANGREFSIGENLVASIRVHVRPLADS
jgi:hypothetical protein